MVIDSKDDILGTLESAPKLRFYLQGIPFTASMKDLLLQTLPLHPEKVKAV